MNRFFPFNYAWLAFRQGLLSAVAQRAVDRTGPLDADETWKFWTEPKHRFIKLLVDNWPPRAWRRALVGRVLARDRATGIEAHYDISNEFYRLWLDKTYMFYSCAKFDSPTESLEQAQHNKALFLLRLLDPRPGEHIFDLGCGWGGMMKAIVAATGEPENLTGISLSRAQVPFVRNTLGYKCEHDNFISREYQPASVDKMITVGSLEHVRPDEIENLHQRLFRALRPGGRLVHQFFSLNRNDLSKHAALIHYFFPGSILSSHERLLACMRRSGFRIESTATDDYRPTLRAWFNNLAANKEAALRLVGVHTYNKYLVFLSGSWRFFNDSEACLHRLLLVKD